MIKKFDLTNQTFGHWTALRADTERTDAKRGYWICRCVCGREKSVLATKLRRGGSKSCRDCGIMASAKEPKLFLTFAHKTAPLSEWAEITGLPYSTLLRRMKRGWSVEEILFTAPRPGKIRPNLDDLR